MRDVSECVDHGPARRYSIASPSTQVQCLRAVVRRAIDVPVQGGIMRRISASVLLLAAALYANCALALDSSGTPVVVTPLASRTTTASGQPITLPRKNVQVVVSTYDIAAGATLPVHRHPFPRYAYVEAGTL